MKQVRLNVLAKHAENARDIVAATDGHVLIGIMVKPFASVEAAVQHIQAFQQAQIPVSVGLGNGDPSQWEKVVQAAVQTKPAHVNQVFPAAGYTLAALRAAGSEKTIVNALIQPSGTEGKVLIGTGEKSSQYREPVSCDAAAAMLAEIGVHSVKFYPVDGAERLDEIAAMVKAAVRHGIEVFEPTGGIDVNTIKPVVEVCLEAGATEVIPHIYSAIVDQETGLTRLEDVHQLYELVTK